MTIHDSPQHRVENACITQLVEPHRPYLGCHCPNGCRRPRRQPKRSASRKATSKQSDKVEIKRSSKAARAKGEINFDDLKFEIEKDAAV